jgi:hypothetical protein
MNTTVTPDWNSADVYALRYQHSLVTDPELVAAMWACTTLQTFRAIVDRADVSDGSEWLGDVVAAHRWCRKNLTARQRERLEYSALTGETIEAAMKFAREGWAL